MHLFGPIEGRRHDAFMLRVSGLSNKLKSSTETQWRPLCHLWWFRVRFIGQQHTFSIPWCSTYARAKNFNTQMSKVRVCVEWGFGKICQNFAFLDFKKNQKVLLHPHAKYYALAAILTNCHTCLYGSLTSSYFELSPPLLETYMFNQ